MKKNIVSAILFSSCFCTTIFANEERSLQKKQFGYVDLGVTLSAVSYPYLLPMFGGGYRYQNGYHGCDINLHLSTVMIETSIKGAIDYLYYPKPDISNQYYVGLGAAFIENINIFYCVSYRNALAPELIFGKEYLSGKNKPRFLQVSLMCPFEYDSYHSHVYFFQRGPEISFSYGWGF